MKETNNIEAEVPVDDVLAEYRKATMRIALGEATQIERLGNELFTVMAQQRRINEAIAGREADLYLKVCDEVGDDKKPKYSNDGARKAETASRASQDAILSAMRTESQDADIDIAMKRERIAFIGKCIDIRRSFLHGS